MFGWLVAVIVIIIVVVLGALFASVGCLFGYCRKKRTPQEEVYEDPDSLPNVPKVAGNLVYGHINQSLTELRGPIYEEPEDIKPDPHTEGNLAYGHVQF